MATKEQIIARRQVEAERYIWSTLPILYLPFWKKNGDGVAEQFISSDGRGFLCSVTGASWSPEGYVFSNDDITIPDTAVLKLGTSDFTLWAWFKTTTVTGNQVVFKKREAGAGWYTFYITSATLKLELTGTDNIVTANDEVTTNVWMQAAMVRDYAGNTARIYKKGIVLPTTITGNMNIDVTNTDLFRIGRYGAGSEAFAGTEGEILIYNRVLTLIEIQSLYLATEWRYV